MDEDLAGLEACDVPGAKELCERDLMDAYRMELLDPGRYVMLLDAPPLTCGAMVATLFNGDRDVVPPYADSGWEKSPYTAWYELETGRHFLQIHHFSAAEECDPERDRQSKQDYRVSFGRFVTAW